MTQAAKAQEPSMEEILASIRRIIADDDGKSAEVKAAPAPAPTAPPPRVAPVLAAVAQPLNQKDIDAVLAEVDAQPAAAAPAEEILNLTEAMAAAPAAASGPSFRTIEAESDVVFSDHRLVSKAEPRVVAEEPRKAPVAPPPVSMTDLSLMSASTSAAVDTAFNSLASTILGQNARTLEDLVKEMLRPMLKSWLDDNLPSLVERIVRAEIERVSRGRM